MPQRSIQRGRPTGTTTYEAEPAIAFGAAVREERTNQGIAQETLAHMAGIERSHMGKIERGEHVLLLERVADLALEELVDAGLLLAGGAEIIAAL